MVSILYIVHDVKFTENYFSCFKQFNMLRHHRSRLCIYSYNVAFEDTKWSRGDSGRPARAHKVRMVFNCHEGDVEQVD